MIKNLISVNIKMYRIAVPSYQRYEGLGQKTLKTLERHGFPIAMIDIFVANQDEYNKYKPLYPEYNIIIGEKGIRQIREFIFLKHYSEGDYVVSIDDDIELFKMKNPRSWEKSCFKNDELDLQKEIDLAFETCVKSGRHLWGIYPVDNHFFMKNDISYDYKFIIGHFFGCIVKKDLCSHTAEIGARDDYERSIKHYLADGGVVRLNYICAKTKYIAEGGIGIDRKAEETLKLLVDTYPGLVSIKKKKDGPNPLLKDKRVICLITDE
tara:strand:- start:574 stop:1371 length:798 start_codon:yes stop_codon:yes gene_type:complete